MTILRASVILATAAVILLGTADGVVEESDMSEGECVLLGTRECSGRSDGAESEEKNQKEPESVDSDEQNQKEQASEGDEIEEKNQKEPVSEEEKVLLKMIDELESLERQEKKLEETEENSKKESVKDTTLLKHRGSRHGNNNHHVKKSLKRKNENHSAEEEIKIGISVRGKSGEEENDIPVRGSKPVKGEDVTAKLLAVLAGLKMYPYNQNLGYPMMMNQWNQMADYNAKAFPYYS